MEKKKEKKGLIVVIGLGLAGIAAWLLMRKAKAAPEPPPPGLANLYGKVTDAQTGAALSGVLVSLDGMQIYTDGGGNYVLSEIEPGGYVLQFSKENYQTAVY